MSNGDVSTAEALQPGTRLSHYRVESRIGAGGMGTVYLASDSRLDRRVAIKVIHPAIASDPDRLARFHREARTVAQLTHPGIVTVFDTGQENDVTFIVTEYVTGTTLRDVLAREGALPTRRVVEIGAQVAEALAAAHAVGITHRDVKPENIMLTGAGRAKLLDFGLAQARETLTEVDSAVTAWQTEEGVVLGTPGYTSPEQLRGGRIDPRSDIFSLGVVLYEMAAGVRPFAGASTADVSSAVLREDPPALADVAAPPTLRAIIDRCLEKDAGRRFQSASDLAFALTSLTTRSSAALDAPAAPPARHRRRWAAVASVTLAALAGAAGLALLARAGDVAPAMHPRPFATESYGETEPVWSPDGRALAYAAAVDGVYRIQAKFVDAPGATTLVQCPAICDPFAWTPDGSRILYLSRTTHLDARVWSIAPTGGAPEPVFRSDVQVLAASLSPDGRQLALLKVFELPEHGGVRHRLFMSSPPGAEPAPVDVFPRLHLIQPTRLAWSADSTHLLVITPIPFEARVVWPNERRVTTFPILAPTDASYSRDGIHAVVARRGYGTTRLGLEWQDTRSGRLLPLVSSESKLTLPAVSPDGSRVAYVTNDTDFDIVEVPLDGSGGRPLLASRLDEHSVHVSPRSDEFAYVAAGQTEIRVRQPSTLAERVVVSQADFGSPAFPVRFAGVAFSPDGTRLAYNAQFEIFISPSNGGPPAKLGKEDGAFGPEWSPDGQWIAFMYAKPTWGGLVKIRVGGDGSLVRLREGECGPAAPAWSPDGAWIACGRTPMGVDLVPANGGAPLSLGDHYLPWAVWARDSQHLYAVRVADGRRELGEIAWRSRAFRPIGPFPADFNISNGISWTGRISLSSDGRSLVTAIVRQTGDIWIIDGLQPPRSWWGRLIGR
jgi:Tol biopolymer transport system component/tRNA A-37 threonylcarbamoyl transferase component Bud32